MLSELTVENLGVIKKAHLTFEGGMVAISGESGAGKSMLLGGLKLLLGGRGDTSIVRKGAEKASVDGTWLIDDAELAASLEERGCELEDGQLFISRIVGSEGVRSRFMLAGRPSPTSAMDDIADSLIEIHGQSDQIKLRDTAVQRDVLDSFGGAELLSLRDSYQIAYRAWRKLKSRLSELENNFAKREMERAYRIDLVKRFDDLAPELGELERAQNEIEKLSHLEEISEKLRQVAQLLFAEDGDGPLGAIEQSLSILRRIAKYDTTLEELAVGIEETLEPLEGRLNELQSYMEDVDLADLQKLHELEERLVDLKQFAKPFGGDLDRAIEAAELAQRELEDEEDLDIVKLQEEVKAATDVLTEAAVRLSDAREKTAQTLGARVSEELAGLAMAGTSFGVDITECPFGPHGRDEISFMIESKGGSRRPIIKAASGGELSRIMLALEVVSASNDRSTTFVFDEIDTGVGGATAMEIGRRLAKLAEKHQVIVVTHLPQVAAWADSQLVISKDTSGEIISDVKRVTGQDRIQEIARMLSGLGDSTTGLAHAEELLETTAAEKRR